MFVLILCCLKNRGIGLRQRRDKGLRTTLSGTLIRQSHYCERSEPIYALSKT